MKKISKYIFPIFVIICLLIGLYLSLCICKESFENKDVIPRNVFLTWETNDLPPKMAASVEQLKRENPEFTYYFYDNAKRREYISDNFDNDIVKTYDALIPGAFRADLWRYCILYKMGGIYMDIKLCTINEFKLINLTNKEYFIRDIEPSGSGVLNGFMVCKQGNDKMLKCIEQIKENVKNKYYGTSQLEPTGPMLLVKQFNQTELNNFEKMSLSKDKCPTQTCISYNNLPILAYYAGYLEEKKQMLSNNNTQDYSYLWNAKKIYDESIVF